MTQPYPTRFALAALTVLAVAGCHSGDVTATETPVKPTLISLVPVKSPLTVKSPDITAGQPIAERFTNYGMNQTPTIQWSAPPAGTKTLILLLEDPDGPGAKPFRHWMVYDIPASETSIGAKLPRGAVADKNDADTVGYFGPHPPPESQPHHYHFEVFAIDSRMALAPKADQQVLSVALKGHTLAAGELVVTYQKS